MSSGSSAGTLISDLDSKAPLESDGDLVQKIMADMNLSQGGSGGNMMMPGGGGGALPPAPSARAMAVQNSPNPNTMIGHTMDSGPATAHVIGQHHPTAADFAALMPNQGMFGPGPASSGMMGAPYNSPVAPTPPPAPIEEVGWLKSSKASLLREMKTPLLVAIIVFVFSLPIINTMVGLYFPRLLRIGGDLTSIGLAIKSLFAGAFFWVLQRVLVPLVAA
jgi:hypothetical protein